MKLWITLITCLVMTGCSVSTTTFNRPFATAESLEIASEETPQVTKKQLVSNKPHYGSATVEQLISVDSGNKITADVAGWPEVIGKAVPVRLFGVVLPKKPGHCHKESELAVEAKQRVRQKLSLANEITLHQIRRDNRFGLVARIDVDGQSLAQWLLDQRIAEPWDTPTSPNWCSK